MRIIIFILILCLNHNNGISQSCIAETYTSQIGVKGGNRQEMMANRLSYI